MKIYALSSCYWNLQRNSRNLTTFYKKTVNPSKTLFSPVDRDSLVFNKWQILLAYL